MGKSADLKDSVFVAIDSPKEATTKDTLPDVSLSQLFIFATGWDYLLLSTGFVFSVVSNALFPFTSVFFGEAVDAFVGLSNSQSIKTIAIHAICTGALLLATSYIKSVCFAISTERQVKAWRIAVFRQVLQQPMQ